MEFAMFEVTGKCRAIVHIAAIVAATIAGLMVHATISDVPFLILVEVIMVVVLGKIYRRSSLEFILTAMVVGGLGTFVGRGIWEIMRRAVPSLDFIINSGTAFLVVELLGWLTVLYFRKRAAK